MFDPTKIINDINLLSPYFKTRIEKALKELWDNGHDLFIFESYRSPQRSNYLYEQGRTSPGKIVTKAQAWQSMHNYALAVDLWPKVNNRWVFQYDYKPVAVIMKKHGFKCGIDWGDSPHFQLDGGLQWQECKAITNMHGLPLLWKLVQEKDNEKKIS